MQNIVKGIRKDSMFYRDILVLDYRIEYPIFHSTCNQRAVAMINDYYLSLAKRKEHYCKVVLYPQAAEAARYVQDNSPPFHNYEFDLNYQITWNSGCMVSLYMEEYTYMGGAHGSTIRTSDTWDFTTGRNVYLKDLLGEKAFSKDKIITSIKQQIAEKLKASPESFFDGYAKLVQEKLNINSFYIAPDGIVIYFQQYDIAPYAAGFPEFLLPDTHFEPGS